MHSSVVDGSPASVMTSAITLQEIGSESTRTPSQSKITSSITALDNMRASLGSLGPHPSGARLQASGAAEGGCYSRAAMRLIITEKNNSAKKIADILSDGAAKADATYKVPFYTWSDSEGDQIAVGLKGHVMGVAFPEGYSNWQETDLHELIDAELVPEPTDKNVVKAIRKLAKDATDVVLATDFDREGELIGLEALHQVLEVTPALIGADTYEPSTGLEARPPIKRARYSALTKDEIERAFSNLDELSYDLAYAGAARQDIDLIWGATLTRAVSLATRRFGSNFLSVGRVQSPTLALIVERELERRAHVPKPFWELFAKFEHPDGTFEAHHTTDKFWDKAEAEAALAGTKSPGVVKEVSSKRNTRKPPTPLNTTAFTTDASSRLGITPAAAMRIAEDLYMDGFISYPRTDNTVYPQSLNTQELVSSLVRIPEFSAAKGLLDAPARRDPRQEGDDRPPADLPDPGALPGRPRGPEAPRLRARRPPLPRDLLAADDHRVDPRRHRGRLGDLLRPRLGRRRPRIRRHLHLRALLRRGDPGARARARSSRSTASRGWSTRRPSRRRGSARAS